MYTWLDTADDSALGSWVKVNSADEGYLWDGTADGAPTITKATDGTLLAWTGGRFTVNTTAGDIGIFCSSADGGATWSRIAAAPDANDDSDFGQLLPLSGGDILFIFNDVSANATCSGAGTASWDASATTIDGWFEYANYDAPFGAALLVHNSTTNIYLAGHTAPNPATLTGELRSYRYNDATRAWDAPVTIMADTGGEIGEGTMFVDDDTGDLYAPT